YFLPRQEALIRGRARVVNLVEASPTATPLSSPIPGRGCWIRSGRRCGIEACLNIELPTFNVERRREQQHFVQGSTFSVGSSKFNASEVRGISEACQPSPAVICRSFGRFPFGSVEADARRL